MNKYIKELDTLNRFRKEDLNTIIFFNKFFGVAILFMMFVILLPVVSGAAIQFGLFRSLIVIVIGIFFIIYYHLHSSKKKKKHRPINTHQFRRPSKAKRFLNEGLSHLLLQDNYDKVVELHKGDIAKTSRFLDYLNS